MNEIIALLDKKYEEMKKISTTYFQLRSQIWAFGSPEENETDEVKELREKAQRYLVRKLNREVDSIEIEKAHCLDDNAPQEN